MHWSDERSFLLNPVDGCVCVWRQEHIMGTTAFGGGGFTVWGCFSLNCKVDLYVLDGTIYRTKSERTYPIVSKHSRIRAALVQEWQQYPQH